MNRPTVLRNSAEPEIVIGIALKIFYDANDWIDNPTFLDRLDREYDAINKTRESRTGGQAIAKYKPALYYGLIDVRNDGFHCINNYGRRYYEAYLANNEDDKVDCLIHSISAHKFGSDNPAVPESCSEIEPPKVFLVSCLLLNNKLSKVEYAYILEKLAKGREYQKILVDIAVARLKNTNNDLGISDYAKNNYRDDKGLKFLSDAGLFEEERGIKSIKNKYVEKYSDVLSSLAIITNDEKKITTNISTNSVCDINHRPLLTALRTKPFLLLAGISGTGKSRIVRELAFKSCPKKLQDADCTMPGNYCMIEVKPNWHDSTELLGYYSNISKKYMFTKFVRFLVKAMMFPDVPFFVCLDEMNLAPVEQYFAEFLSVLETRKKVGDHIVSGALVDKQFFNDLAKVGGTEYYNIKTNKEVYQKLWETTESEGIDSEAAASDSLLTVGLTLPDNVFVIGTVNMDDTTHQFSRKVIDRAMTIEMNGGDLKDMFGGSAALNYMPEGEEWKIDQFRPRYVNADEVIEKHSNYAEQIKKQCVEKLQDINTLLKGTPFEVSYRVLNELVIYLGNLLDEKSYPCDGNDEEFKNIVQEAFDAVTLMKILPRVEGDDEMFNLKNEHQNRLQKMQDLFSNEESGSRKKLQEMDDRLGQMQFTRFWP